jgi:ATP-dependent RNA helicase DDX18/HAS1
MPIDDTVSEAQAWATESNNSCSLLDTTSEPPRFSDKLADKIMNRAYTSGGMDPEESVAMDPEESMASSSVQQPSKRSVRTATWSHGGSVKSKNSVKSNSGSHSSQLRHRDSGSISGRSQLSALERRLESGGSSRTHGSHHGRSHSSKQSKSSRAEPTGALAPYTRRISTDPPSVAGSVKYLQDSHGGLVPVDNSYSSGYSRALVPMNAKTNNDPPSTSSSCVKFQLSTCDEETERTERSRIAEDDDDNDDEEEDDESNYNESYNSQESSGSYNRSNTGSTSGYYVTEEIEDADDSMMASVAENALAIRDNEDITVPSVSGQSQQQRALVACSVGSKNDEAAMVAYESRYLASAVDNHAAMVPFDSTTFESYDHTFVKCPEDLRFLFLYTFLKKNSDKKVIVFFSTTNSLKFHSKLLQHFHIPCLTLHSKQNKQKFINTFLKFSDMPEGILCATDAEGRDLDIPPSVDWVLQFEPPEDPTEYILRVSRISCDSDRVGRSLLFLNPGERGFLKYYQSSAIPVSEFEIPKLADIQGQIEHHVNSSDRFRKYAKDGYGSYLIAYASHSYRDVYNVHDLNKEDVAAAFGLISLPESDDSEDECSVSSREMQTEVQAAGQAPTESKKTWSSTKKPKEKTWMKGEKSWPHCRIKVHPKFKEGYVPPKDEDLSE